MPKPKREGYVVADIETELEVKPAPERISIDGRYFDSPLDAALHLLWLLQRLSRYDEGHVGEPCDGFRFREGIVESRKLLKLMGKDVE